MPFAQITMLAGRSDDKKRAVIEKVTDALVEALDAPRESVRVCILEVPDTQWGIGGVGSLYGLPDSVQAPYGDTPLSFLLFARLKL